MASGTAPNPNGNYVESAITVNSDYIQNFDLKVSKSGRVVNLYGRVDVTTQIPAYTTIFTLPDGFYSTKAISVFMYKFNGTGILYWIFGGKTLGTQSSVTPGGTYYINQTWVI